MNGRLVCARCVRLSDEQALARLWHGLWRHGWRGLVAALLDVNAHSDPAKFIAGVLAVGAVLAVVLFTVAGFAARLVAGVLGI